MNARQKIYVPMRVAPLILVPTGETVKIGDKTYRILEIKRAES